MRAKSLAVFCVSVLSVFLLCNQAYAIGFATPFGWAGSGVRVANPTTYADPSSPNYSAEDVHVNGSTSGPGPSAIFFQQDFVAHITDSGGDEHNEIIGHADAFAQADYYELHGEINHQYDNSWVYGVFGGGDNQIEEPNTWANGEWTLGTFFRDEIFLETVNGQDADINLVFNVNAHADFEEGYAYDHPEEMVAKFRLAAGFLSDDGYYDFGNYIQDDLINNPLNDQLITMTISNLESGTYMPFSIGAIGTVYNSYIDFGNTVTLSNVYVEQNGVRLDPSQYTLTAVSGDSRFPSNTPAPVPEPTTLLLSGMGLLMAGVCLRRKMGWR